MKIKIEDIITRLKMLNDPRILGLMAFGVIALLITWSSIDAIQTNYEVEKKISVAKQKVEISKLENQNLKLRNTYFGASQFLELSARRQFGKAQPGEKLYIIPKEVALKRTVETKTNQPQNQETAVKILPKYRQNLRLWVNFLFN